MVVYPNPFKSHINIDLNWEEGMPGVILLYHLLGELCHHWEFRSSPVVLNTRAVPEGTYIRGIQGDDDFRRVVVKRTR